MAEDLNELLRRSKSLARELDEIEGLLDKLDEQRKELTERRVELLEQRIYVLEQVLAASKNAEVQVSTVTRVSEPPRHLSEADRSAPRVISLENVGPLAKEILALVDADPSKVWKSRDFITAVVQNHGGSLERNRVSTTVYRLKNSGLIGNDGTHIFSVKRPGGPLQLPPPKGGGHLES